MLVSDETRVGAQIAARRIALGMPIKALAELAGVHRDTISAIEAGTARSARSATVGAVTAALDRFEEECGIDLRDGTRRLGAPDEGLVELTFEGVSGASWSRGRLAT